MPGSRPRGRGVTRRSTASSTPSAAGPRPTATNSSASTSSSTRATPARGSTARPSTASATPPARASSTSSRVYSPDRLARRYAYQVLLLEEFRKAGCEVEFVHRPISDDPHDQLLLQIQGAVAEYERAVARRAVPPRQAPEGPGRPLDRRPGPLRLPLRPRAGRRPGHLEVDEAEAEVVRMLYRWLIDERMTVRQILKRLAAGPWRPRCGKRLWSNCVVHRILSDPVYAGTAYANRHVFVVPRKPRSTGPRAGTADLPPAAAARGVDPDPGPGHHRRVDVSGCAASSSPATRPCRSATTPATTTCCGAC